MADLQGSGVRFFAGEGPRGLNGVRYVLSPEDVARNLSRSMSEYSVQEEDPRNPGGPFGELMADIRSCKERRTCPSLKSRRYYFEPNPVSAAEWRALHLYSGPIDRRVVFVCESPGPQFASEDQADPARCWAKTGRDRRFKIARERYGFISCYLTNTVKCGVRSGSRHCDSEVTACRGFLVRELQLLKPIVAVGVGRNAYRTLREATLPFLDLPPTIFEVTHYSARGDVWPRWEQEFTELRRLLSRLKPRAEW